MPGWGVGDWVTAAWLLLVLAWVLAGLFRWVQLLLHGARPLRRRLLGRSARGNLAATFVLGGLVLFSHLVGHVSSVIPSEHLGRRAVGEKRIFVSKMLYRVVSPQRGSVVLLIDEGSADASPGGSLHLRFRDSATAPGQRDVPLPQRVLRHLLGMRYQGRARVRRIIGMPGESVTAVGGRVFIEDVQLQEPYVRRFADNGRGLTVRLGPREYLTARDFRDERALAQPDTFVLVHEKQVYGREFFVFWPREEFGFVRTPVYNLHDPPVLRIDLDKKLVRTLTSM